MYASKISVYLVTVFKLIIHLLKSKIMVQHTFLHTEITEKIMSAKEY